VALALIFLYPLFLFLGWVVAGHRVGCCRGQGEEPTVRTMMIGNQVIPGGSTNGGTVTVRTVFVGLLVISGMHILYVLLRLFGVSGFPITFIMLAGFFVSFTASLVGLGALIRTRFRLPPAAQPAMTYAPAGGGPVPPATPGGVTTPPAQPGSHPSPVDDL